MSPPFSWSKNTLSEKQAWSVDFQRTTRRYITGDRTLHYRSCQNLKSSNRTTDCTEPTCSVVSSINFRLVRICGQLYNVRENGTTSINQVSIARIGNVIICAFYERKSEIACVFWCLAEFSEERSVRYLIPSVQCEVRLSQGLCAINATVQLPFPQVILAMWWYHAAVTNKHTHTHTHTHTYT
jgi:hypothetical protein